MNHNLGTASTRGPTRNRTTRTTRTTPVSAVTGDCGTAVTAPLRLPGTRRTRRSWRTRVAAPDDGSDGSGSRAPGARRCPPGPRRTAPPRPRNRPGLRTPARPAKTPAPTTAGDPLWASPNRPPRRAERRTHRLTTDGRPAIRYDTQEFGSAPAFTLWITRVSRCGGPQSWHGRNTRGNEALHERRNDRREGPARRRRWRFVEGAPDAGGGDGPLGGTDARGGGRGASDGGLVERRADGADGRQGTDDVAEVVGFTPAGGGDGAHLRGRDTAFRLQAGGDTAVPVERADGIVRSVGSTAVPGERGVR